MNHPRTPFFTRIMLRKGLIFTTFLIAFVFGSILFPSCSRQRTQTPAPTTSANNNNNTAALGYTNANTFHTQNQQQEQVFTVDSPGTGPIVGAMGTKLYPTANIFMFPNGGNVVYPFTIKLVEIYPNKDIILSNMPPIAGGKILDSKAEIRVRAYKDTTELVLRPGKKFNMQTATVSNILTQMSDFYGFQSGAITDWTNNVSTLNPAISPDTLSSVTNLASSYSMNIARMGWMDCAKFDASGGTPTTLSFTTTGNNIQNIEVYLVFQNIPCVMKAYNLVSGQIPIGTNLIMVAFAMNASNQLVYDKQTITVTAGQVVTLNMQSTTSANLLSVLAAL